VFVRETVAAARADDEILVLELDGTTEPRFPRTDDVRVELDPGTELVLYEGRLGFSIVPGTEATLPVSIVPAHLGTVGLESSLYGTLAHPGTAFRIRSESLTVQAVIEGDPTALAITATTETDAGETVLDLDPVYPFRDFVMAISREDDHFVVTAVDRFHDSTASTTVAVRTPVSGSGAITERGEITIGSESVVLGVLDRLAVRAGAESTQERLDLIRALGLDAFDTGDLLIETDRDRSTAVSVPSRVALYRDEGTISIAAGETSLEIEKTGSGYVAQTDAGEVELSTDAVLVLDIATRDDRLFIGTIDAAEAVDTITVSGAGVGAVSVQ
jgi:hypothetical protein